MLYANYYHPDRTGNASFMEVDLHHTHNPTYANRLLRKAFLDKGIELNNPDVNEGRSILFSLFHDGQPIPPILGPKFLIATENPFICKLNANLNYFQHFDHVFTWNRNFLQLSNLSQVFIPNQIETSFFPPLSEKKIFTTIINTNKRFPFKSIVNLN